ncbi:MAG: hypothetical protein WA702_19650 [Bradyrhizobium sp.]
MLDEEARARKKAWTSAGGAAAIHALIRDDCAVLARFPAPTAPGIVLPENTAFRRAIAAQERSARLHDRFGGG